MMNENYTNLLIENNQLKKRIYILKNTLFSETLVHFYTDIINKNVEINNLKIIKLEQENLELKNKILI
jgi:hypothetical protein